MDFIDAITAHATRIRDLREHAATEEATKTSLILPFLRVLGYDAFDPRVVIPEYTCDVGSKKGEKVDYAIKRGDDIIMLIEAKCVGTLLNADKEGQLLRYFNTTPSARIAILTDGIVYNFYTDLEKPNIMDEKPFMVFDFTTVEPALVDELKKLCNDCFDTEIALCAAQDLKYLRQIKQLVAEEVASPSDDMVKIFAKQVFSGPLRNNVLDDFRDRVRTAFEHHYNDVINARLKGAIQQNTYPLKPVEQTQAASGGDERSEKGRVVTTEDELEGYHIVKAILREVVDPDRVVMRDTISYCGVLLDDNNRKPLCRLHFNSPIVKYIETFDAEKKGTKQRIEKLNDIYGFADILKETVGIYE